MMFVASAGHSFEPDEELEQVETQTASEHNPEPARQHAQHGQRHRGPEQLSIKAAEDTNMVDTAEEDDSSNTQDLSIPQQSHVQPDTGTVRSHNCMQNSVHDAVSAMADASRAAEDTHFHSFQQHSATFLNDCTTGSFFILCVKSSQHYCITS